MKSKQLLGAKLQCVTRKHSRSSKYCMKGLENSQLGRQKQTPECMFACYYVIDDFFLRTKPEIVGVERRKFN